MSASTLVLNLTDAFKIYTLAVYFVVLTAGLIGNFCIIIVFEKLKIFQHNQCAFYLITAAIVDIFLLPIVLPLRVVDYAFNYDVLHLSLAWCKIRQAIVPFFSLMSFSAICFASIDQYIATHCSPWIRQLSTLKLAHRVVFIACLILALHSISFLIFFEIHPSKGCGIYNQAFLNYYSYVHFCVWSGILPITVSACSSLLAYMNVRRIVRQQVAIVRRRLDRQLTAMVLMKSLFLIVTISPFVSFQIYILNRTPDPTNTLRIAIENLFLTVTSSLFYVNSAGTFYVFLMVSRRFRHQLKRVFVKNLWRKFILKLNMGCLFHLQNQVAPASDEADLEADD